MTTTYALLCALALLLIPSSSWGATATTTTDGGLHELVLEADTISQLSRRVGHIPLSEMKGLLFSDVLHASASQEEGVSGPEKNSNDNDDDAFVRASKVWEDGTGRKWERMYERYYSSKFLSKYGGAGGEEEDDDEREGDDETLASSSSVQPFILCSYAKNRTGIERLQAMREALVTASSSSSSTNDDLSLPLPPLDDEEGKKGMNNQGPNTYRYLYNQDDKSCVVTSLSLDLALSFLSMVGDDQSTTTTTTNADGSGHDGGVVTIVVQPLLPSSKIVNSAILNAIDLVISGSSKNNDDHDNVEDNEEEGEADARRMLSSDDTTATNAATKLPSITALLCPAAGGGGKSRRRRRNTTNDEDGEEDMTDDENETLLGEQMRSFVIRKLTMGSTSSKMTLSMLSGTNSDGDDDDYQDYPLNFQREQDKRNGGGGGGGGSTSFSSSSSEFWAKVFTHGKHPQCLRLIENMDYHTSKGYSDTVLISPSNRTWPSSPSATREEDEEEAQTQEMIEYCAVALLSTLSLHPSVCQIEVMPPSRTRNAQAQWLTQTGVHSTRTWYDVGLTGKGELVAASDTGIDVDNCYFWDSANPFRADGKYYFNSRKVVQYIPYTSKKDVARGHGTHVAGTIVGKRAIDGINESTGMADGIAPGARLAFIDLSSNGVNIETPIDEILATGRDKDIRGQKGNAHIHSSSWGTNQNYYSHNSMRVDDYSFDHDDFLHVIAAGNAGAGNTLYSLGEPATAKNCLAVGASHSSGPDLLSTMLGESYVADFSSRGPTADGRTKPDIVAPGHYILSAGALPSHTGECDPPAIPQPGQSSQGVSSKSGTSMATPVVAGAAALIREYFQDGWYPQGIARSGTSMDASGALVKAVLMNGGQYMKGVDNGNCNVAQVQPYDSSQNFGRVSLVDSLYIKGYSNIQAFVQDRKVVDGGDTQTTEFQFDQSDGCRAAHLSATLVWVDPANSVGCANCVVNHLDLSVDKTSNGQTVRFYPNGLRGADVKNNAERVQVSATNGDTFVINVHAQNLFTKSQQYALVVTGCFGGVANQINTAASVFNTPTDECVNTTSNAVVGGVIIGVVLAVVCACCGGCYVLFSRRRRSRGARQIEGVDDYRLIEGSEATSFRESGVVA